MKLQLKKIALLAALIFSVNLCNAAFPVKETPAPVSQELIANNLRDGITETRFADNTERYAPAPAPYGRRQPNGTGAYGITAAACAFAGIFVASLPLGIAATVFGIIGISPNYTMKGLAIAGIIMGVLEVIIMAAYLSTL